MKWFVLACFLLGLILVPFAMFGSSLERLSVSWMESSEYFAIKGLLVIVLLSLDPLLPIPSSIVSTWSGAAMGVVWGTLFSWLGMTAGCLLAYGVGRFATERVEKFVGFESYENASLLLHQNSALTLVLCRPVPVLAEASALSAGAMQLPLSRYIYYVSMPNFGIAIVYSAVGTFAISYESFLLVFAGAIAVPAVGSCILYFLKPHMR